MTRELNGAVVAVVGASGGLGRELCDVLRSAGAELVLVGRSEAALRDLVAGSAGEGPGSERLGSERPGAESSVVVGDVTDPSLGDRLMQHIAAGPARLDGVILASGVVAFGSATDVPDEVVEELFLTNVVGPLWLISHVVPALTQSRGFLLTISGLVAQTPMPGMVAYSASKVALAGAAQALGKELRRQGVQVTDAQPPHTETGLAGRAIWGTAPAFPPGADPLQVAERIVAAVVKGERVITADLFG